MNLPKRKIAISGAGLVGSLLSIYLVRRGYEVDIFERRSDMRSSTNVVGRSINLALSNRGLRPLIEVGLADQVIAHAIPMFERRMHDIRGNISQQPYGKTGQFINSISRSALNIALMDKAESAGVKFHFEKSVKGVDFEKTILHFDHYPALPFDLIFGSDGAYSPLRGAMQLTDRFNYSQYYIEHGYKELHIPASSSGAFQLFENALHIWPRESFMMIALPNPDKSFTCTLFLAFEGNTSFDSLQTDADILHFFHQTFPDATALMPTLLHDFHHNPTSSLVTIQCYPWQRTNVILIGDAAHAIVPFFGQGMNAGFEDCYILNQLLDLHKDNWDTVLAQFQSTRKPDVDAIASLALNNFIEMRDLVADPEFLLRKKIEAKLHELYPDRWIPLYSMVTFHETMRYSDAMRIGQLQKEIMDQVMTNPDIESSWQFLNFEKIVSQLCINL